MKYTRITLVAAIAVLVGACRRSQPSPQELEPTPPERTDLPKITRQIPAHEPLPGTNARTALLLTQKIPGLGARVEIREYYISEGNEVPITPTSEALFEIRSGRLVVDAREMKGERTTGTTWTAAPKDRIVVRALSELAVLRATYIVKE
jgi:hypothetical protein